MAVSSIFYLRANRETFLPLLNIQFSLVLWLIIAAILFTATNGLFLQAFAAKFGVYLKPKEWFGLAVVARLVNYLTPFSGGLIVRATYLKQRHDFPYAQFATLLASNYLISFWVIGVVGLLACTGLVGTTHFSWMVALLYVGVVAFISFLILLPAFRLPEYNRLTKLINTALTGWSLIKNDKFLLTRLVLYTLINILLNAFSFWLSYLALEANVPFLSILLVSLLTSFSVLINITPGNLGVREAIVTFSSGLLGIGAAEGLLAALLIRAATILVAFTLGPIFSYLLAQEVPQHPSSISNEAPN